MILNHRLSNREICAFLLLPFSLISVVCEGWSWNDSVFAGRRCQDGAVFPSDKHTFY